MRVLGHDLIYVGGDTWEKTYAAGVHPVRIRVVRTMLSHWPVPVSLIDVAIDGHLVAEAGIDDRELLSRIHRRVTQLIQRTQGINL